MDVQVKTKRWTAPGETLMADDSLITGGGKGANVALMAAKLGCPVILIGQTGNDPYRDISLAQLRKEDIDLSGVGIAKNVSTGLSIIITRPDGDKNIFLAANANDCWPDEACQRAQQIIQKAPPESILVCDFEIPPEVVDLALTEAKKADLITVIDPSPAERFDKRWSKHIDYLAPNRSEATKLTGVSIDNEEDMKEAAQKLHKLGIAAVAVKGSNGGCIVVSQENCLNISSPPVEPVDKTGAGDAFAGGLAGALLAGYEFAESFKIAVVASSLAVTKFGSQESYEAFAQIQKLLSLARTSPF